MSHFVTLHCGIISVLNIVDILTKCSCTKKSDDSVNLRILLVSIKISYLLVLI